MLYIRTYRITFLGHWLAERPLQHPWHRRLLAWCRRTALPSVRISHKVSVLVRIQGPDHGFMDREYQVRERFFLAHYRAIDPHVALHRTIMLCEGQNLTGRPFRDRSAGQSEDYERWVAEFYNSAPGPIIEDHKEYEYAT